MKWFNSKNFKLFLLGFFILSAAYAQAKDVYSPVAVKIQFKKKIFKLNEPIEGQIVLVNAYPVTLPAIFEVQLFRDDKLFSLTTTEIRTVIPGRSRYTLQEFGVPAVMDMGRWRLSIGQPGVKKFRAAASFKVVFPTN